MDIGQQLVILISVFLVVWFLVFSFINRRIGQATYHWLRSGLTQLGTITEARWIGSSGSGARLAVSKANKPFQRVEAIFLLLSREIMPLWLFNHLRGKRDEVIVKATLRNAPLLEVEVSHHGDRSFDKLLNGEEKRKFTPVPSPENFQIATRGSSNDEILERLRVLLAAYPDQIQRISLQRATPHLIVRYYLSKLQVGGAEQFISALTEWLTGEPVSDIPGGEGLPASPESPDPGTIH